MSEHIATPFEHLTAGMFKIAAGIGAIALGVFFFNKAKDSGKKQLESSNKS